MMGARDEQANAGGQIGGPVLTDEEVVARVRAGDTAAYEILMRRHNRTVYRVVRSVLRGDDDVEDVMQQAYLSAFAKLDQFRNASRFSTWLVAVALNEARGRLRRRTLHAISDAENADPAPASPITPENEVAMREVVALVERAVEGLPAVYRTVFVLRHVEGLDTADTAAALGVSEDVVKTRLHRACVLLRERLAADLDRAAPLAFEFLAPRCDRVVAGVLAKLSGTG